MIPLFFVIIEYIYEEGKQILHSNLDNILPPILHTVSLVFVIEILI